MAKQPRQPHNRFGYVGTSRVYGALTAEQFHEAQSKLMEERNTAAARGMTLGELRSERTAAEKAAGGGAGIAPAKRSKFG
jgi:hypothetical protein